MSALIHPKIKSLYKLFPLICRVCIAAWIKKENTEGDTTCGSPLKQLTIKYMQVKHIYSLGLKHIIDLRNNSLIKIVSTFIWSSCHMTTKQNSSRKTGKWILSYLLFVLFIYIYSFLFLFSQSQNRITTNSNYNLPVA